MSDASVGAASTSAAGSAATPPRRIHPARAIGRAYREHPAWMLLLTVVVLVILVLAYGGYFMGWTWTGFEGNTFWDWLSLLITPVTIAIISIVFSIQQTQRSVQESEAQRQEALLEAYIAQMSRLLVEGNLRHAEPDSPVRAVARAHTLATLQRVGERQKDVIVRFLDTSGLLADDAPILDLRADHSSGSTGAELA